MCRTDERTHKHHIIPRYMGGPDTPENLVEVTVTQHAIFHFCNYQLWSNEEDRIAWRGLSRLITLDEAALEALSLGGKKGGNKNKENKTGFCGLSSEELSEAGKKGGKISGNKHKENKTGIFKRSPQQMTENGKKGGKISGNKHKENKTGICGLSLGELSESGKKGGKASASQKWKCTVTGFISHSAGLTRYQNKRGIDTSKRIKIDSPRSWEITFEDGNVVVITKSLKSWGKENGYNYDCLLHVRGGKIKNHKGIIKVVPF